MKFGWKAVFKNVTALFRGEHCCAKSDVAEPTQNPIWNATFDFTNVPGEELMERTIEVTLWDYCPDRDSIFLGKFMQHVIYVNVYVN